MKIKDRFEFQNKAPVLTVKQTANVYEAVHIMSEKNYGACVVINDEDKPVGIVTERDFMRRLIDKNLDAHTTPISQIMTHHPKVAGLDDNVLDWLRQMSNERFRHVPVVDSSGKLINLLSQGDFVSFTWPQLFERAREDVVNFISPKFQPILIGMGIMIYTIIMFFVLRHPY